MSQYIYKGENFKGQQMLTIAAVVFGVVASIYSIRTSIIQKRLSLLQHEEALEKKKERELAKLKSDPTISAFDGTGKVKMMSKDKLNIPDGKYKGTISGYTVTLEGKNGASFTFNTNMGVKGRGYPVAVSVEDRIAYIKVLA